MIIYSHNALLGTQHSPFECIPLCFWVFATHHAGALRIHGLFIFILTHNWSSVHIQQTLEILLVAVKGVVNHRHSGIALYLIWWVKEGGRLLACHRIKAFPWWSLDRSAQFLGPCMMPPSIPWVIVIRTVGFGIARCNPAVDRFCELKRYEIRAKCISDGMWVILATSCAFSG